MARFAFAYSKASQIPLFTTVMSKKGSEKAEHAKSKEGGKGVPEHLHKTVYPIWLL